ncbi:MAG: YceI family protein [Elusimicrobia bacterium]|nr:YceI family protein [Elusimicrobiota bacterium]
MTIKRKTCQAVVALAAILAAGAGNAAVVLAPESRIRLSGDSTLHPFSSTATKVEATVSLADAEADLKGAIGGGKVSTLELTIPVEGLKSGEKRLDKNMYAALKAEKFSAIQFVMKSYRVSESSGTQSLAAIGDLSIAGEKKETTVTGALTWRDGRAVIDGSQELLMTEFGIKPPSLMLGAIKVKDRIVIGFHLELQQTSDEMKPAANLGR